jgi:class 3 adenylate cyclase
MVADEAPETRYARTTDGAHIAYQVLGEGAIDLLELPGASYVSIDLKDEEPHWCAFERRLASFSRLIRFDLRGVGLSDPISTAAPPSIEDWVADAEAVLDAAGSEQAAILGHGRGGMIAMLLSATRPERVRAQVLANTYARVLEAPDYPAGMPSGSFEDFVAGVVRTAADGALVDDVALLLPSLAHDPAFRTWWQRAGRAGASPAVAQALYTISVETDLRAILPTITTPTLVLHRGAVAFYGVEMGRYLGGHIPGARYVELEGSDHFLWAGDANAVLQEIEVFLTGESGRAEPDRVLATVMFTDIVGSTQRAAELGDRRWRELLDVHDRVVRRQLERFRGREVKTTGDGFLATFDGPARAVRCAQAIRDAARQVGIDVRAGLHTGEVEQRGVDLAGIAVHLTQRVCGMAEGGQIATTRVVVDLVAGSGLQFADIGEHDLKGIPGRRRLFTVTD